MKNAVDLILTDVCDISFVLMKRLGAVVNKADYGTRATNSVVGVNLTI